MSFMISVTVCTYNRCDLLEQIMQTLINQTLQKELYEIIIVDNNSKDNTSNIADQLIKNNPEINIRYIIETKQGLSHARNRGWKEAKGEYVAYIDDDCKASEQWLEVAKRIIDQHSPAIFGGPYYAYYNSAKPKWFKDSYGSHKLGDEAHLMDQNEFISGGNIFFRRSLLQKIGGFDPKLGMTGNKIGYGEETALQIYVRESMPNELIYYDPKLYVYHLVRPEKMSLKWRLHQSFSDGRYSFLVFQTANEKSKYKSLIKLLYSVLPILCAIVRILFRDRKQYPYFENYIYERISPYIANFGKSYEQFIQKR